MATRYIHATSGDPAGSTGAHTSTHFDTTTEELKSEFGGTVHTFETKTAKTEVVSATNVITASESGKVFFLNSATEFVSTLPAVTNTGARFKFVVSAAPSGASYTVVAASGTPIVGQILTTDVNAVTDPAFSATGVLTITFVDAKAVKGDWVEVVSDGTNWFVTGACSVFDAITLS